MIFEILINDSLLDLVPECGIEPAANKSVLSIANDFEDGGWRYSRFLSFVWDNVALTCLSQRERQSLVGHAHTQLVEAARRLRLTRSPTDPTEGSELAEVVLYGLMHLHFGALPVVPKIFYKQNRQDNAKGSDSVHIVTHGDDFSLWLGEAKFYSSIEDARLPAIISSVAETLTSEKLRKETSIVTSLSDLDTLGVSPPLLARIKSALDTRNSIDDLKPRLQVPILLLHECELTRGAAAFTNEYRDQLVASHKERATAYFKKQVDAMSGTHLYSAVRFHVILFPVPSKAAIVERFVEAVTFYRNQ
jgi:hypothetical protein